MLPDWSFLYRLALDKHSTLPSNKRHSHSTLDQRQVASWLKFPHRLWECISKGAEISPSHKRKRKCTVAKKVIFSANKLLQWFVEFGFYEASLWVKIYKYPFFDFIFLPSTSMVYILAKNPYLFTEPTFSVPLIFPIDSAIFFFGKIVTFLKILGWSRGNNVILWGKWGKFVRPTRVSKKSRSLHTPGGGTNNKFFLLGKNQG